MDNGHIAGAAHGTYKSYLIGFILSVVLTVIPFWMVMHPTMAPSTIAISILGFAIVQVLVHLYFFLHLNTSSEQRWNLVAFAYTFILILFIVVGSLWIMHNLGYNMMLD